jgi:hypothetical protein
LHATIRANRFHLSNITNLKAETGHLIPNFSPSRRPQLSSQENAIKEYRLTGGMSSTSSKASPSGESACAMRAIESVEKGIWMMTYEEI